VLAAVPAAMNASAAARVLAANSCGASGVSIDGCNDSVLFITFYVLLI
jgi:hypothetical protein